VVCFFFFNKEKWIGLETFIRILEATDYITMLSSHMVSKPNLFTIYSQHMVTTEDDHKKFFKTSVLE